ncbi:MAG: YeeE/YedE family protein [Hyphomicrobiaceae bacterium]
MEEMSITTLAGLAGLIIGFGFGALTQTTNFCTMGAVADAVSFGDFKRARAWLLAVAVAIIGAQALQASGVIDLGQSIYLSSTFNWFGSIIGGLIFGFGMVLASGCPGRNLARVGGGDLKALVVLILIGFFGYATLRGITGLIRVQMETLTAVNTQSVGLADHGLGTIVSGITGMGVSTATLVMAAIVVLGLLWFCFRDAGFRASQKDIIAGLGLGALITAGWWVTGVMLADEFDPQPLASLTFVAPAGNTLQYLMTFTGSSINFGIATVFGAILGAFVAALVRGRFAISGFSDKSDTLRHFAGATMMGFGGVVALGCTIGQCISGMSTLALGSVLAFAAIVVGGVFGMKYLERALGI